MNARHAMLFAAGLGTRLRPLTDHTPKPLVQLGGRALIDYGLERLCAGGFERIVVNTHHHAEQLVEHLRAHPAAARIQISHEPRLLETGGGIVQALPWLGPDAFLSTNSDAFCIDGPEPALTRLLRAFDPAHMDALLLLVPLAATVGYHGGGDFDLSADQRVCRSAQPRYVFSGCQVLHPRLFAGRTATPWSLREIYRAREQAGGALSGIYGLVHDAAWVHVGTPDELAAAERYLERG